MDFGTLTTADPTGDGPGHHAVRPDNWSGACSPADRKVDQARPIGIDLSWDEEVGVALNERGDFIISGHLGTYVGNVANPEQARDVEIDLSDGEGVGVALNDAGDFVVSGHRGTYVGNVADRDSMIRTGVDLSYSEDVGAALNNSGNYVLSGHLGTVVGLY